MTKATTLSFVFLLSSLPITGFAANDTQELRGTWLIREGLDYPTFLFARNGSVFAMAVDEACLKQGVGPCKELTLGKLRENILANPYVEELAKQNFINGEIAFKLRAHEGETDFAYHLKREGDKLTGFKKDLSFKSKQKHFFRAEPVS